MSVNEVFWFVDNHPFITWTAMVILGVAWIRHAEGYS